MFDFRYFRYFENNSLLENSSYRARATLANCTHHVDTFRDSKYVFGSPMVRMHYEYPTSPSLKGGVMNEPAMWWEVDDSQEDIFEDANDYGYVSTHLTHLTKCGGYDCGELLSNLPMYDVSASTSSIHAHKKLNLIPQSVHANFLRECRNYFFQDRSDAMAIAQKDCLHNPSLYVLNRKSLIWNKSQVFYNDNSSYVHCLPLCINSLKWSESFLEDCVNFHAVCKYEEPIRSVALDMDWAKLSLFSNDGKYYWRPPIPSRSPGGMGYEYHFSIDSQVLGMVNWCLNNTCIMTIPKLSAIHHVESLMLSKWKRGNENVMWMDVMKEEWQSEDNIKMVMKDGQVLSLDGILGSCHGVEVNDPSRHLVISRLCNNRCAQ